MEIKEGKAKKKEKKTSLGGYHNLKQKTELVA